MRVSASALLLAATAMAAPAAIDTNTRQTCTDQSLQTREWLVKDFEFHASYTFSTPAHQNSWGYVNFTLENPSLEYKSQCEGQSGHLNDFFYGDFIYKCKQSVPSPVASFTFSRPSGQLMINQTWACPGEGSRFWAEGGTNLTLKCKDETWQNPEWKQGQIYSSRVITCDRVDAHVPIDEMAAVA